MRGFLLGDGRQIRVAGAYFGKGICFQPIDEIVGFDTEAFAPAHLDIGAFAIFL